MRYFNEKRRIGFIEINKDGAIKEIAAEHKASQKEWLSLNEVAEYIGVAPNTLKKFRNMGLPICEVEGTTIKRVSRTEIDRFMQTFSNNYGERQEVGQ